jgi:superfamily II helicase
MAKAVDSMLDKITQEATTVMAAAGYDKAAAQPEKRVKIIIEEQDNHEGHQEVRVGVNGKVYQIQRGKEVSVPESVVSILRNAIQTKIIQQPDGSEIAKDMPRFVWRYVA